MHGDDLKQNTTKFPDARISAVFVFVVRSQKHHKKIEHWERSSWIGTNIVSSYTYFCSFVFNANMPTCIRTHKYWLYRKQNKGVPTEKKKEIISSSPQHRSMSNQVNIENNNRIYAFALIQWYGSLFLLFTMTWQNYNYFFHTSKSGGCGVWFVKENSLKIWSTQWNVSDFTCLFVRRLVVSSSFINVQMSHGMVLIDHLCSNKLLDLVPLYQDLITSLSFNFSNRLVTSVPLSAVISAHHWFIGAKGKDQVFSTTVFLKHKTD